MFSKQMIYFFLPLTSNEIHVHVVLTLELSRVR